MEQCKEKDIFQQLKMIFQTDRVKAEKEFGKAFYKYYQRYFRDNARLKGMLNESKHIARIANAEGKRVLDLGCGFGLTAIQLKALGAKEVVGLDVNRNKIEVFKKLLCKMAFFSRGVLPLEGDGLRINSEDRSFDVIIVREVISHIRDLDLFLNEVNRILKKDGVFYIKDDNNAFDIRGRISRRKIWKECEFGSKDYASHGKSYRAMRKDMLRKKYPQMNINDLQILAEKTAGMWGQEIYKAADVFLKDNIWPLPTKFKYRNPETGEFPELEFNPYYLKRLLKKFGYKARVIRPFYSYTYSGLKGIILSRIGDTISLLYPVSLLIAPTFEIIAVKK